MLNPITIIAMADTTAAKGPPTFGMVAYTGGILRTPAYVKRFSMGVVVDLAGLDYATAITANVDHDPARRVGHVTEQVNDGRSLVLNGIVSATGPDAMEVTETSQNGYPWQASIEVQPLEKLDQIPKGQSININGRMQTGPFMLARKSRLHGVAFLARGADTNTIATIAAGPKAKKRTPSASVAKLKSVAKLVAEVRDAPYIAAVAEIKLLGMKVQLEFDEAIAACEFRPTPGTLFRFNEWKRQRAADFTAGVQHICDKYGV